MVTLFTRNFVPSETSIFITLFLEGIKNCRTIANNNKAVGGKINSRDKFSYRHNNRAGKVNFIISIKSVKYTECFPYKLSLERSLIGGRKSF
jgi:hypothetical protein